MPKNPNNPMTFTTKAVKTKKKSEYRFTWGRKPRQVAAVCRKINSGISSIGARWQIVSGDGKSQTESYRTLDEIKTAWGSWANVEYESTRRRGWLVNQYNANGNKHNIRGRAAVAEDVRESPSPSMFDGINNRVHYEANPVLTPISRIPVQTAAPSEDPRSQKWDSDMDHVVFKSLASRYSMRFLMEELILETAE